MEVLRKLLEWLVHYGMNVVGAIVILVLGWLAALVIRAVVRKLMVRAKQPDALVSFVSSVCFAAVLAVIVIAALARLGVQTASIIAILAAAGLAIGLALQGSLANFASGFLIVLFQPFRVGDYIDAGAAEGVVEKIEVFTTTLLTPDNKKVIVPNSKITGGNIVNYSAKDTRRVDLVFGVAYSDDLQKVQRVLLEVLESDNRVLPEPAPTVAVLELADSTVNFAVRPWVKTSDYWDVHFALTRAVKQRFDAEGISIPFPQRDVHLYKAAG